MRKIWTVAEDSSLLPDKIDYNFQGHLRKLQLKQADEKEFKDYVKFEQLEGISIITQILLRK